MSLEAEPTAQASAGPVASMAARCSYVATRCGGELPAAARALEDQLPPIARRVRVAISADRPHRATRRGDAVEVVDAAGVAIRYGFPRPRRSVPVGRHGVVAADPGAVVADHPHVAG
jgi:hypothetical protein